MAKASASAEQIIRLLEESARGRFVAVSGQQEVHCLTEPIDGSVQVLPLASRPHVRLIDPP